MSSLQAPQDNDRSPFILRDGTSVSIREFRPEDMEALKRFANQLSDETVYFRFLTSGIDKEFLARELSPEARCLVLIAVKEDMILGHVSYCLLDTEAAEVGLLVLDGYQGKGMGTGLLERIAKEANAAGVSMFEAIIGWNNTRMIQLVRTLGFPTSERVEPEVIRIRFPTSIDPVSIAKFQERWVFKPS